VTWLGKYCILWNRYSAFLDRCFVLILQPLMLAIGILAFIVAQAFVLELSRVHMFESVFVVCNYTYRLCVYVAILVKDGLRYRSQLYFLRSILKYHP